MFQPTESVMSGFMKRSLTSLLSLRRPTFLRRLMRSQETRVNEVVGHLLCHRQRWLTRSLRMKFEISGSFTSGNNGAISEGTSGRVDIAYHGVDIVRARDLGLITKLFSWCRFPLFNLRFPPRLEQSLGDVWFNNTYTPAKERHDFPMRNGDQWWMEFEAETVCERYI